MLVNVRTKICFLGGIPCKASFGKGRLYGDKLTKAIKTEVGIVFIAEGNLNDKK